VRKLAAGGGILILMCYIAFATPSNAGDCLEYEPAIVKLTGKVIKEVCPGPPNFESVAKGDQKCVYWFLHLDQPVCVKNQKKSEFNGAVSNIGKIQLVLTPDQYQKYKVMINKKVIVVGQLFGACTGHHYTPVLINQIKSMTAVD
jgi:hypothetical protein